MAHLKYGTPEFYCEHFSDLLADVDGQDPATADSIIQGFLTAVDEWFDYHERQADAYAKLRERVREALAV
jgi:hypothetical protein